LQFFPATSGFESTTRQSRSRREDHVTATLRLCKERQGNIFKGVGWLSFKKIFFYNLFFLKYPQWQCILSYDNSTAMYKFLKTLHPGRIQTWNLLFCRRTR
jgi:hypothetical protein